MGVFAIIIITIILTLIACIAYGFWMEYKYRTENYNGYCIYNKDKLIDLYEENPPTPNYYQVKIASTSVNRVSSEFKPVVSNYKSRPDDGNTISTDPWSALDDVSTYLANLEKQIVEINYKFLSPPQYFDGKMYSSTIYTNGTIDNPFRNLGSNSKGTLTLSPLTVKSVNEIENKFGYRYLELDTEQLGTIRINHRMQVFLPNSPNFDEPMLAAYYNHL